MSAARRPGVAPACPPSCGSRGSPALALVVLPVVGLVARSDLGNLPSLVTSPGAVHALDLSLRTAVVSTVLCLVLGGPLAVLLARSQLPGLRVVRALVLLPLVLPPVVGGLALLYLLGRKGFGGQLLYSLFGIRLSFTTTAVVLAQTFVAMPFLVVGLEGALRTAGQRYELVAATLGASPGRRFAGSPCRWCCPRSARDSCCASPAPWASSARRSPSRAVSRG